MDTLTHALSGALLARATAPRTAPPNSLPRRVAAGFLAGAAPDLDIVFSLFGPLTYLANHRGITHSLILLPLWALLYAWLLSKLLRDPGGWRALYGVTAMALGAHIAGDLITSFGTMVLAPFSDWRAGLGTTFIIDLWFSGIIVTGLAASLVWRRERWPAIGMLVVLCAYVGFQYTLKQRALEYGAEYARQHGFGEVEIKAQPRPVTPYNWTVFLSDATQHRYAHVNLARGEPLEAGADAGFLRTLDAPYQPLALARWESRTRFGETGVERTLAQAAWNSEALAFYRWFAELPAYDGTSAGSECVWFKDLRFIAPGRPWVPFNYGACREREGAPWKPYERDGEGKRPLN